MILVIPCAGKSSRFPGTRPKFLLTHPDGEYMIVKAIEGIDMEKINTIFIISLLEYEEDYHFKNSLITTLERKYPDTTIIVELLHHSTKNQPETIYKGLRMFACDESILIKDCDNTFNLKIEGPFNSVAVGDLNKETNINPSNKSYIQLGNNDQVVNIVEKQVVSSLFCAGAYYFKSLRKFNNYYERLQNEDNLYVSHIIYQMILDGEIFMDAPVQNYIDWGTLEDWQAYVSTFRTLFVDIDGVLVKCGRAGSGWGNTDGIEENIKIINKLYNEGRTYVVLTTSRPDIKKICLETSSQLHRVGIKYHKLIMSLPHCQRVLINDFAKTNPYPSAIAINIERDTPTLKDYLK